MIEIFFTAFIVYFVVVDPIGSAPVFLAVTSNFDKHKKIRIAIEGCAIASSIMLFFAICGAWILSYLNISEAAFKISVGIILFLVALDMLTAKRQQRKREETNSSKTHNNEDIVNDENDNVAIYPLAIPLLAGPAAIMSVIVVNSDLSGSWNDIAVGYFAMIAVMFVTAVILSLTALAESWLNEKITMVFSRVTAIILAGLSIQYVLDGLNIIGLITA